MPLEPREAIRWNQRYAVGVAALDAQHKQLIELMNNLQDAMFDGRAREVVGEILESLIRYTETHFAFELGLLRALGYPGAAEQEAEHEELKRQVLDFQKRFQAGALPAGMPVMVFLRHWLIDHISTSDQQYASFLQKRKV